MWTYALLAVCVVQSTGCALTQEVSRTPRSAIEQLLLSQSVENALTELTLPLPMPHGVTVTIEMSGLNDKDLVYVREVVSARLGKLGYKVKKSEGDATFVVHVQVEAMGTNQGRVFIGMPPIQSVLIPFSLPQITLYEKQDQLAHVRLHLDLYESSSGRLVHSTPKLSSSAYYNQYTVLFFFSFRLTDLLDPPV